jgi:hypothetical protein
METVSTAPHAAVTIFSQEQLTKLVADTLPPPSAGHTIAVVGTVDQHGAQVVAGFTSDNQRWRFNGAFRHDWNGDNTVGAQVMYIR